MYANAFGLLVLTALLTSDRRTDICGRCAFTVLPMKARRGELCSPENGLFFTGDTQIAPTNG